MNGVAVIDASLAVMWAIPESHSGRALDLAERWARTGTRLLAPYLLIAEVTNALYKRVVRGDASLADAQTALGVILAFSIELREEPGLVTAAMALAHRLKRPATYDCHYLALAERYRCELWTGDERFYNAINNAVPQVRWVGASVP